MATETRHAISSVLRHTVIGFERFCHHLIPIYPKNSNLSITIAPQGDRAVSSRLLVRKRGIHHDQIQVTDALYCPNQSLQLT
jgi:hypothetical protein